MGDREEQTNRSKGRHRLRNTQVRDITEAGRTGRAPPGSTRPLLRGTREPGRLAPAPWAPLPCLSRVWMKGLQATPGWGSGGVGGRPSCCSSLPHPCQGGPSPLLPLAAPQKASWGLRLLWPLRCPVGGGSAVSSEGGQVDKCPLSPWPQPQRRGGDWC